jgi:hypothetical protein
MQKVVNTTFIHIFARKFRDEIEKAFRKMFVYFKPIYILFFADLVHNLECSQTNSVFTSFLCSLFLYIKFIFYLLVNLFVLSAFDSCLSEVFEESKCNSCRGP